MQRFPILFCLYCITFSLNKNYKKISWSLLPAMRVLFLCLLTFSAYSHNLNGQNNTSIQIQSAFIKNQGQWKDGSQYQFRSGQFQAIFFPDKILFSVAKAKQAPSPTKTKFTAHQQHQDPEMIFQVWEIAYSGAGLHQYVSENPIESRVGYVLAGNNSNITYPEQYSALSIKNLYPGVDARFSENNGVLKIDYIIAPGQLPEIAFSIKGFKQTAVDENGNIVLQSEYGRIVDSIPHSYSQNKEHTSVSVGYEKMGPDQFRLKFPAGFENPHGLVVDPFYMDYSTYFYGNNFVGSWTYIYDVDVDDYNNSYITGITYDKFPGKPGTYDTTLAGASDAFLCKIPSGGGKPDYFIYVGGSSYEYGYAIATKENGDAYLTGYTVSTDYPVTSGVFEPKKPTASYSSFVTGIKSDGSALIYSTFIRGYCWVIDVNEQGQVYVAPYGDALYQVTKDINPPGQVGGGMEANIIRINATGTAILNCVALIGSGTEYVYALSIDKKNQVYAAGWTNSDNLPVTLGTKNFGGFYKGGSWDGFLFKVDSAFTKFLISKYIGTSGYDYISAIAVNDNEDIFIQGIAGANELPVATNAFPGGSNTGFGGSAFIMRIFKNGVFPRWTTYITNSTYAWRQRISINTKDECVFAGSTSNNNLPTTTDAYQKTLKGGYDGFIGKLSIDGAIRYLSYFGGSGTDYFFAVQTRRIGCVSHILMGGWGSGNDYPTLNAWKSTINNNFASTGRLVKWRDTLKVDPIDFGPDVIQCDRNYRILDPGNPGADYKWQDGSKLSYFIVQKPGKYWINASYGCGFKTDTISFKIAYSAKSYFRKDTLICNRYGLQLDAKNDTIKGIKYLWNTGDTTRKIFANSSGKYLVSMWTPVCQWRYDSIVVNKQYKPIRGIHQADTLLCKPLLLNLRAGTDTITAAYLWNTGDTVNQISINKANRYHVAISNVCGSLLDTVGILADSIPTVSFKTDTLICDKDSFVISRNGFSKWTTLSWNDGSKDSSRTFKTPGTYSVNIQNTCKGYTDTVKLKMGKIPKPFSLTNMLWCDNNQLYQTVYDNGFAKIRWSTGDTGKQLLIKDTGVIVATAESNCGISSATFRVSRGFSPIIIMGKDTLVCNANSFNIIPKSVKHLSEITWENGLKSMNRTISNNGKYWASGTNNCGTITDSIQVEFLNAPVADAPADLSFCDIVNPAPTLTAKASGGAATYAWNNGDLGLTTRANNGGTYVITGVNACGKTTDSTRIVVHPSPLPNLGIDTAFCGTFAYPLNAGNGWKQVIWSNGSSSPAIVANNFGQYRVTVTDINGCSGSDEITIGSNCKLIWYIPTAFTPNNDGRNDLFTPTIKDVQDLNMKIYDRWGSQVWDNKGQTNAWDGNINGNLAPEGVYIWRAEFRSNFKPYYKEGTVTLMR